MTRGGDARAARRAPAPAAGTSLVELLVALGLASTGLAALAALSSAVLAAFEADPAAAEQQQRARATMAVLVDDIAGAGAAFIGDADTAPGGGCPAVLPDLLRAGAWAVGAAAVHPRP